MFLTGVREKGRNFGPVFNVRIKITTDSGGPPFKWPDAHYYANTIKRLLDSGLTYEDLRNYREQDSSQFTYWWFNTQFGIDKVPKPVKPVKRALPAAGGTGGAGGSSSSSSSSSSASAASGGAGTGAGKTVDFWTNFVRLDHHTHIGGQHKNL